MGDLLLYPILINLYNLLRQVDGAALPRGVLHSAAWQFMNLGAKEWALGSRLNVTEACGPPYAHTNSVHILPS